MTGVLSHSQEDLGVRLNAPQERVAARAEHPPHPARFMAVIHEQFALGAAYQTPPFLCNAHRLDLVGSQPILTLESSAEILGSGRFGVRPTPLTQSSVSLLAILLAVAARYLIAARLAPGVEVLASRIELRSRLVCPALDAGLGLHVPSLAWHGQMAWLDQPCHADVLLELANA